MKFLQYIYIILIVVFQVNSVFSQQPENTRNLSKYAKNHLAKDAVYQNQHPHQTVQIKASQGGKVKNVILIIGDGMGLSHISSAWVANQGKLNLDNFPVVGLSKTYSHNRLITDSGAAGTAIATGKKTNNYVVGVDTLGNPLTTIIDYAVKAGKKTGITVVCRLNDATPAAFAAHQTDRDLAEEIVSQYPASNIDYIAGGGMKYWRNRSDEKDMVEVMKQKGYAFAAN
ncbi:MAG: alkaline phosphatase, partial [Paludibacter sp.]|nr:alkaline phosphatase [Paludibacter sp.]